MNIVLSPSVLEGLTRLAERIGEAPPSTDPRHLAALVLLARAMPGAEGYFPQVGARKALDDIDRQLEVWARSLVYGRLHDRERYDDQ